MGEIRAENLVGKRLAQHWVLPVPPSSYERKMNYAVRGLGVVLNYPLELSSERSRSSVSVYV